MALQLVQELLQIVKDKSNANASYSKAENGSGTVQPSMSKQHQINKDEWYQFLSMTKGRRYISELIVYGHCREDLLSIKSILNIIVDFYNLDEKTELKDFIESNMNQYDLDRNYDDNRNLPFKDKDKLYESNFKQIDELDNRMIHKLLMLKELIQNGLGENSKCFNMDKESMVPFWTSGFCLNKAGGLVIFNER